jgi:hypothetical protein
VGRPIDVLVHHKRGQRWLRSGPKPNVLGVGILERARATSLALLGATAAVGLAIVAIAVNQEWPLIAGSSVPPIPPRHQNLGEAKVAAGVGANSESRPVGTGSRAQTSGAGRNPGRHAEEAGQAPESTSGGAADFVVAPSAPAKPRGGESHSSPQHQSPPPAAAQPQPAAPETAAASPTAEPVSSPAPPPASVPEPLAPPVTASEAPPESSVPPWSHGNGHAYGRSEAASVEGDEPEGDDYGSGDYGHGSYGHHHGD